MNTHTQFIYITNQIGFNTIQPTRFQYTKEDWLHLLGASEAAGRPAGNGRINQRSTADLTPAHWLSLLSGSPQTGGSYANGRNGNETGLATAWEPVVFLTPEYWLRLLGGSL
ncbi:MAG TPA: hypothetical protein VGD99_24455 [Anaerolineae bacterium]|jgi:hypothetical protein